MKRINISKVIFTFAILLISNAIFSNSIIANNNNNSVKLELSVLTVDAIAPTTGHAGTVVTITGSAFTSSSIVLLGATTIPVSNIQFISSTELQVTIPCNATSGYFTVDGVTSTALFTYVAPTISTLLPNLTYCEGTTVSQIVLAGTPTIATTAASLEFSWTNTNTNIGLAANGTGAIPTFTALNTTLQPITSTITVTPSINSCLGQTKSYTITINPKPVATPISNILACAGANVAQINLTASSPNSGTGTSFSWSGTNTNAIGLSSASGTTSPIPAFVASNATNGLVSSLFSVTPTFQGCVGTPINFTIDVAPLTLGGTLSSNGSVCSGAASGLLTLANYRGAILTWESSTTGGAPWTSIANTAATYQSGGLLQTTYFRVAVQNSGCPIVYSTIVTITVNNSPSITGNLSVCNGATTTLLSTATPATNAWQSSNQGVATISSTGLVTGVSPGTTIITYTNSNGCSTTASFVVGASPIVLITNPAPVCSPNTVNLTASSITTGSSSNLNFTYFTNQAATNSLSNSSAVATSGTYYIKGTDANGCSTANSVTTLVNALPTITISGTNTICANESTLLTASGASNYSWNSGLETSATINVTPTNTTSYTVNATDNNGCIGTATVMVTVKTLPTVNAGLDRSVCSGSSVTLAATGAGVASYSWNNAVADNVAFIPSATTTYTVTGLGANGCFNTDSALVTVNTIPNAPLLNVIQPNCSSNTGAIQFSGLPTTGNWTINPGSINGSGATYALSNQTTGTYTFSVKDSNLCNSANASTTVNTAPSTPATPTVGAITQPNCSNSTGTAVLSGLPSGNWTITKSPGGETYTNTGNSFTITNLSSGTYTFSVSNGTCSSLASSNVVIDAAPNQSAPVVGLLVQPTCSTATGSVTLSGLPSGNWTLTRVSDGVTFASSGSSTTLLGLATGNYNYTVTNANGCISTASGVVVINSQPASPAAPIANAQSFLASANATISNLQIVSTGTPNWYSNAVGGSAIATSTLLTTGIYYASQTINGCESAGRTSVSVSVFPNSLGGVVSGTTTVCYGTNSTILTLSSYTGSILRWESSTVSDFSANVLAINIQSTTYTATNLTSPLYFRAVVQSGISPIDYASPAFIDVVAQTIGGTLSSSTAICLGGNSGLLTVTGYTGTILRWEQSVDNGINWTSITNTTSTYTSGALLTTTQYRVAIQNGVCPVAFSSVATITVKSTPVVTDIPNQEICFGDTQTFGDPFVGGYTYSWTSDTGYSSILPQISLTFNQVVTQNYTYTVTNTATGCSTQDQFQVIVNPLPSATVSANTSICEGNSITIGANSNVGSTYSWSSVPSGFVSTSSNPSVTPAVTTTYILEETITASTCKKTNSVTITVQPIPVITIVGAPQFHICETTTQVQLNATITNLYASRTWSNLIGSGNFDDTSSLNPIYSPSMADIAAGSVTLRLSVIGSNPCTATYTQDVVILIDKKPIANAGLDVITCGTDPVQINATNTLYATNLLWSLPSGISGTLNQGNPYTPIFTPSVSDQNYVGPIVLTLTASSNTTCPSTSDTVSILITPAPKVDAGPPTATICEGNNYLVPFNAMASQNIVNSTILWTNGTGDGTIVGGTTLTPTYIPGVNDIANGSVTLTLSASGNTPCSTPATDNIIITIVKNPIVNAGPDTLVCQGSINVNATIQNPGTILWTVQNGNGNFVDPTASSPIYIPALTDLNTTVTFTVTVTPINNCGPSVSDSVLYTINATPSVVAGGDATICQSNTSYQLQATATNTTSITWTSTGSGSFDNIHNEDPVYTLSPNDILAGSVTFTITGTQSGCSNDTDTMVLTIQKNPTANAGAAQVICQGDIVVIPGTSTNSNSFSWIRNGGTGAFLNANTVNPTYISQLSESGTIYLTLIANAIAPCTVSASSDTTISIIPRATADAGNDAQICEGASYHVTTATASNNVGVQWSTNGDGTFTGGSTISPIYTPGPSDNNNGTVILTLVATKNFPCNANAVDQMTLTINKIPVITVINPDVNLCVGAPSYSVTGVVPTNYDTLVWSTSGSGTFAPNNTALAPTYFPSASDYTLGTVTLTLTASRNPLNCNSSTSNTITLHFISKPTANAGPVSASICEGFSYVTNGATATNYANVTWATSGSGTFINATTLLATYTPSAADYNLGFVNLTLSANPLTPCSAIATDVIRLDLQKAPVIIVRADDTICITQNTYAIGGTSVTNYVANSEVWTSSGTGTFSPSGDTLNPIYNPSTDDLAAGSVTLTITVNSIAPCIVPLSNSFVVTFQKLPVANAGPALTECDTPFHITTATATLSTVSSLVWSTSGTGTFDYTNVIDPIYTPSAFDVLNSPITLTLTGNAIAPCTANSVSTVVINLVKSPVITVTPIQATVCEDATNVTVLGTTVLNQSSYIWTSTTGTIISNNSIINPIVTPSAQDIINNQMLLTITAQPVAPCGVPVSNTVTIPIQKKPSVFTGAAQTICEGTIITTSDALSSNVTNLHWTNNGGDGTFTTSNLNTITEYTPGTNEIASGQVLLTLIGDAIAPCSGTVSSTITYTIIKNPIVTINPTEVTICETEATYTVPASFVTLVNPSSILSYQWTTTNMASLTGATTWTPTYTPTAADIATGFVTLTLTVNPIAPCATPIVTTLQINISKQATISYVNDGFFCESTSKPLTATFTDYDPTSISWTIVNGTGSITGGNTATPTYVPASDSGTVVIRISVASLSPCTNIITEDFTITGVKKPIVAMTTTTDTVCSTQLTYSLAGNTAQFADSLLWTRVNPVGTGTFSNATILNPVYTFNAADIANGFVTLRLTASSTANCSLTDYKEITINITEAPTVVTASTETICQDSVFTATALSASNYSSVLWTTVGTSNGTFTNANQLVTQYTQGTNDLTSFTIQVTAIGNAPCAVANATKVVTIQSKPILDAGLENRFNCSSEAYAITGVTGQNLGAILWTSNSGAPGTFSDPTALNPTYTPSATELTAGNPIILTVTAQAVVPCLVAVSDFIVLHLTPNQVVDAGTYPSICEGSSVSLIGSATNASSVNWTSSGTGTFSAVNSLISNYVPSNSDIINGTVTLTLHAISATNCPEVLDTTVITIIKKPTATAGINVSICEDSSYTVTSGDATAANYTSISWTATGPGALDLSTINTLTPTYIPVLGQTGTVTLTLTAFGNSACGINAVSEKTITIVPKPFATIPSTKTICEGTTLTLSTTDASAINYNSLQWASSNGLGTFTPNNAAATIYTPATGQTGIVTLTLTAPTLNNVCPSYASSLQLNIIAKPIVEAGTNGTICQTGTYTVSGASVQNSNLYSWSVSGAATILAGTENTLSPVIVPNAGATGTVIVTLTAVGNGVCPVVVSDFLTIQINPIAVVNAGADGSLCEGTASFALNGTVTNATSYTWTTTGGGLIQQTANPLAPIYIPSASDFNTATGVNVITINLNTTTTNGCSGVSDSLQLTLYAKPKVNAGGDLLACQDTTSVLLNGAAVSNYNSNYTVSWSSSGNGTWDYTNSNGGVNPVYIFGTNDTTSVTLTMSALPNASCPQVAVTDSMIVTIHQNPTITTTASEITMCGETFTMPDLVTVTNSTSILWTNTTGVSGTPGTLTNATTETPIFTPSANEIANGFALLTLTALPPSGCTVPASTVITINLQPKAVVYAGTNITACQGEVVTVNNNASVQNYTTYLWSENGTGTIDPITINTLHPKYYPGTNETGVVTFTLQATNLAPCSGLVTQTMTLTISAQPTVTAGPDATICQNTNYTLGNASVANNTAVLWLSSQNSNGTSNPTYTGGTFNNPTIINPNYTPSQDDINLGYVYLTVRATNTSCNSLVTDVIKITISGGTTVAAGSNATICEGAAFTLAEATQTNATTLIWTSSQNSNGTSSPTYISGSFSSTSILNPIYTPSLDDINLGHVYLTLTGSGGSNCPISSSQILLTIVKKPTVSTTDVQMCMSTPQISLNGVATNYQSLNWSIYSGPGSISPNLLDPLSPTFISGISGLATVQTTVVRLYVTPNPGCAQATAVYDDLIITIQPLPTVEAGSNGSVCYASGQPIAPFAINGTVVTNASVQNWTTSGVGIFNIGTPVLYQSLSNSCTSDVLTLTANGIGACSTNTVSDSVTLTINCTIPSLGTITSNAPTTICQGTTATYSIPTNTSVQTYTWSVPTGATIQSGQGTSTVQVLYSATASSGNVAVTGTNGCGSVIASLPIIINTLPTGVSVSGPQTVCAGATSVVYTASTIPNATSYVWTLPNGNSITTATNTITVSYGLSEVSGNLSVSGSNACGLGSASATFPITINPQPTLSSTLNPTAVCSGSVFNYTPTSSTVGNTFTWTRPLVSGISNIAASGSGFINETLLNTTTNVISVVYQITTTTTQGCTNTQNVIVAVNPAPSLTSTATPAAICSGTAFNYTPTSASVGTITWIRNATTGITELASNGSGTINEVLTNNTSSAITVTYLLTIPATTNGCTGATATQLNVVVNPKPQVTVNSIILCAGASQTITATSTTAGTYSYVWTVPTGVTNPGNLGSFSVNTVGTYSVIITDITTTCSSSSASGTVTSVPLPIVTVNSETICQGATTTLTATPTIIGNYNYVWTVPTGVSNPGNTNSLTSGIAGIYSVVITNTTSNCSSASASGTITINPLPVVTVNSPSVCAGVNATVIATPSTIGNYSYAWTVPTGASNPGNVASFTTPIAGVYSVIITNTTTLCSSSSASGTVTVNPIPTVIVNNVSICAGASTTITATPGLSGSYSYAWTVPTGVLNPGNTASFSASIAGTYSVIITNTATNCTSLSASGIITVNPIPTVTVSSAAICAGFTTTLTATPTTIGNYNFAWTVPTGAVNPGNVNSITSGVAGTYSVVITDATTSCSSISTSGTISINPLPVVTVNSPAICAGASAVLTATPATVGVHSYSWTVPVGAVNPGNIASFSTSIAGIYSVVITNTTTSCISASASGTVTVNPIPTVTVNNASICAGSSTLITATPGLPGTYTYVWTVPSGANNPGNAASFSASIAGTYSVIITNTATNCSSLSATGIVTVNPIPTVTVSSATICEGLTATLTATPTVLGNYYYTWTVLTGAVNPGNATSITSGIAGTYSVVITDTTTNCSSLSTSGAISINPLPVVTVNSPAICAGASAVLTATPSTVGIYSYSWTVPVGAVNPGNIASFSTSIAGIYSVVITNTTTSCISASASGTVTVNPIPTVTVNNASICAGSSTLITATPGLPGTYTYVWTVPSGANNPGNAASFSASIAGTYSVIITNTATNCSSLSATGIVTVNPIPTVTVSSATICEGLTATLTATPTILGNYNYTWTIPTGAVNPGNANSITSGIAGTYSVVITDTTTNCSSLSTSGSITVNPLPIVTVNNPSICIGSNAVLSATPSIIGAYSYAWIVPTGATNPGNVASFSTAIAGIYSVVITNTVTNCFSASASGTVTVNPLPVVTVNSETICAGTSVVLNATPNLPGNYSYAWIVPTGANNPGNTSSVLASLAGTYSVIVTNLATNCSSILASGTLTVVPLPTVTITNPTAICAPNTIDITTTTTGSSPGLSWSYWNNSAATIALANPTAVSISGTYYVKGTNSFGCSTIQPVVVIINASPMATISGQNSFVVCQNGTQPIITFTGSNGVAPYLFSYQIDLGPIQTVASSVSSNSTSVAIPTTVFGNHIVTLLNVQDSGTASCSSTNITLPNSAFVEVQQVGTIIPVNQTVVSQIVCQTNSINPIVFTIGGASTNAYVTNLPAGLAGSYNSASQTLTISGIPLVSGIFNYIVHTSGSTNGCNSTYGGTLTVNSNDNVTALTSATVNQTVCSNAAIQPIVYNLGGGATGGIVTFSPSTPAGIIWSITSNVLTISGASSTVGTFTYTVESFGLCGQSTSSGILTINNSAAITLVSGNPNPIVCVGTSFATPIQYSVTPATASMVLSGALPAGVTFDTVTGIISGTPSQSGTFPFTISSTTGCGNSVSGVLTVNPTQSISYVSGNTNQVVCQYSPIDPINFLVSSGVNAITITPALPAGITYTLNNEILTVSGMPTAATSLAQNFTISTQGPCGPSAIYSITFDIRPEATITFTNGSGAINQAVCQSSAIIPITFTIGGGATGIITPNLPAGLTLTLDALTGIYTIQGNPLVNGIYNFPITTSGCPNTVFVTISNVNSSVGITLTSPAGTDNQTLCQTTFNSPIQPIIYNVIGATSIVANGLPAGVTAVFSPTTGVLIISGTATQAGIFNYTITSLPCSIVKAGVIRISTPIFVTNEVVTNISCSSNNDGAISVTIVGGVAYNGLYAVHWAGPNGFQQNQTTITGLQAGQYVLTGTDAIGCPIPTMTYTVLPAQPINIALQSSTNVSCNGALGCANFNITGGSGIYTLFTLQFLDPSSQTLMTITPANNNYYNICNLQAGLYYLTVKDSNNCISTPYLFTIYDYSSLSISYITMDSTLCQDTPGKIRIKVNSLDQNLSFYYNTVLVPFVDLGNNIYELSIDAPTVPTGIIKVKNGQNCWVTKTVSTAILTPDFTFTSNDFQNYGYYSVNGSVQFTNLVNMNSIPAEYDHIVWDFGDNTPFKVFYNPADLLPNSNGENFETVFHTYTTNGIYQITLTVYNQFGCSREVTKTIVVGSGATMMLPTIFTPNNDGINDLFRPSLLGLKDVTMYIYDNWGNMVYEFSSDVSLLTADWGWNGIEKGKNEPMNNDYRYYIMGTTINDIKIEKEGRFLLVK